MYCFKNVTLVNMDFHYQPSCFALDVDDKRRCISLILNNLESLFCCFEGLVYLQVTLEQSSLDALFVWSAGSLRAYTEFRLIKNYHENKHLTCTCLWL